MVSFAAAATFLMTAVSVSAQVCPSGSGTLEIAGSSTVRPVADAWKASFETRCSGWTVNVRGGGSSAGARQVCNQDLNADETAVEIGDMSREWRIGSEATTPEFPWLYECAGSNRAAIQALVGYDGLSIAVARNSIAARCIATLPGKGLTMDQLRWIYSEYTEDQLLASGWTNDLVGSSAGDVTRRTWAELAGASQDCPDEPILISGADDDSGTQSYFREQVFSAEEQGESFAGHPPSTVARVGGYINSALDEEVVTYLLQNPTSIGYFGYAYVVEAQGDVQTVPIYNERLAKFVDPSFESIAAGEYEPFSRPIYMNVLNEPGVLAKAGPFLAHGYSTQGDADVRGVGYIPTSLAERTIMLTRLQAEGGVDRQDIDCGPSGEFTIAGSSTVFPVAELWAGVYTTFCHTININVFGGGSSVGACRVCGQCDTSHGNPVPGPVDIGDMSRNWKDGKEATTKNGWEWSCASSDREAAQVEVAIDGLSVVTAQQGPARECIELLGGLSRDQLRWIYSDLSVSELIADGWDEESVPFLDSSDNSHLWSELDSGCSQTEILISGADPLSGTYDYMKEYLFTVDGENFDDSRPRGDSTTPSYFNSALDEDVVSYVVTNEAAVGYFGYSYFIQNSEILEAVPIFDDSSLAFVEPNPNTIEGGSYPIARRIFMNLLDNPASTRHTLPFLEFGLSPAGQQLVALTGYSAIPEWENYVMHARIETDFSKDKSAVEWLKATGESCASDGFTIAGSSTVRPVADIWAGMYEVGCDVVIEVFGGGSGAGAARVCANSGAGLGGPVEIGDMSREWKDTEASELTSSKPREYQCKLGDTTRKVAQVQVATDGLTLAVKKDSAADKCIQILGGLTLDQIRWMYSSLNEVQLESGGDWDPESIPFSDGLANTHKWNELSDECADAEILISGADSISGTYEYFSDVVFKAEGETFGDRPGASYVNNAVDEILVDYLLENEAAISYFGYTYFFGRSDVLASVPVYNDAVNAFVAPDANTIASGRYAPYSRPIYMNLLTTNESFDDTTSFIRFGLSKFGEQLVEQTGYVPIPQELALQQIETIDAFVTGESLSDDGLLSGGAIAGIVVGVLVAVGIGAYVVMGRGGSGAQPMEGKQDETGHEPSSTNSDFVV